MNIYDIVSSGLSGPKNTTLGVTYDRSRFTVSKDISLVVGETFKRPHDPKPSIIGIIWNQNVLRFLDDIKWSKTNPRHLPLP